MRKMIFVMTMALGTAAQAQGGPQMAISPACRTEMQNLCPATGDRDARRACMMEKRDSISATCRAEIKTAMEARKAARAAEGGHMDGQMGGQMGGMPMGGGDQGSDGGPPPQ